MKLVKLLFVLITIMGLCNCSSDSTDGSLNLPNEAKVFVGFWDGPEGKTIGFFEDGTCWYYDYGHKKEGTWAYDHSTKILATTLSQQWQVTLSDSKNWVGNDMTNHAPYTFNKMDDSTKIVKLILPSSTWGNENRDTLTIDYYTSMTQYYGDANKVDGFEASSKNFVIDKKENSKHMLMKIISPSNFDIHSIRSVAAKYGMVDYYMPTFEEKATFSWSYKSPKEMKMQLTGCHNTTLKFVTNK